MYLIVTSLCVHIGASCATVFYHWCFTTTGVLQQLSGAQ